MMAVLSTVGIIVLVSWAMLDWGNNIDVEVVSAPTCTATTAAGVLTAGVCSTGFYGATCADACPGLTAVGAPATSYSGLSCSGFGACNSTGSCHCDIDHQGLSCSEPKEVTEPLAYLPIIIALIGLFVFLFVISVMRLKEAYRVSGVHKQSDPIDLWHTKILQNPEDLQPSASSLSLLVIYGPTVI